MDTKITAVERQKNNRFRYNIYVNDQYAFGVHEDILVKYRLVKGREIDPEEMEEILRAEEQNRAEQYALRYLGLRPRTAEELLVYLQHKGFENQDCKQVVERCMKVGYINDHAYARQWVEERKRLKPRGKLLLRQELLQRGIQEKEADDALKEKLTEEEEREMIRTLIHKKYSRMRFQNSYEMKKKIIPYLQRKGFLLDSILKVMDKMKDELIKKDENES